MTFVTYQLYRMTNHPDYVKWPSQGSTGASWWLLSDNWECTVLFPAFFMPFFTTAFANSFGAHT